MNCEMAIESRRGERVENAESLKDSSDSIELNHKIDCHDLISSSLAMTNQKRLHTKIPFLTMTILLLPSLRTFVECEAIHL